MQAVFVSTPLIRIGTRASQLAQWQANWVASQLRALGATVELVEITTQGDTQQRGPIANIGFQGVFTKEIQAAVLADEVDIAVHSLKDLPTETVDGLVLAAVPERESSADALVAKKADSLMALPAGARVGTGSLRRQAQLRHLRPELDVVGIRGNVDTRLRKLEDGEYDAVILAASGLKRLGLADRIVEFLEPPRMLPAPGQGALGLECRAQDAAVQELLGNLDDRGSHRAVDAERAMLAKLHGGCSAPVGAWGRLEGGQLVLDGLVATVDGSRVLRATATGQADDATAIGYEVAGQLLAQGAAAIVAEARGG
ncbi:MAG: hydroxymethylbilane synthase [Planctomycetes bacterium]|nr:hydroxymethylbilane synthase [Planctomycetota bacterium]